MPNKPEYITTKMRRKPMDILKYILSPLPIHNRQKANRRFFDESGAQSKFDTCLFEHVWPTLGDPRARSMLDNLGT